MNDNNILFDEAAAPIFQNGAKRRQQPARRKSPSPPDKKSGNGTKKGYKEKRSDETLAKRAEMLAEDPYMTPSERSGMDGGSKKKQKKADSGKSESDQQNEPNETDDSQQAKKELDILVSRADKILFRAKTVFPFDFFPDTVTIDANKVDITLKSFFATEAMTSIMLKEIMDVRVHTALFMAKLIIDYGPHPLKVKKVFVSHLWRADALKAKEIIEGMLLLYRGENIDTTKLKPEETIREVREIGRIEDQ